MADQKREQMRFTTLGEALPKPCLDVVMQILNEQAAGKLVRQPGEEGKDVRQIIRDRALAPHRAVLEKDWDLDYLSYTIVYAAEQAGKGGGRFT